MMTGPFLGIAAAMCVIQPTLGFVVRQQAGGSLRRVGIVASRRLFQASASSSSSSSSSSKVSSVDPYVSRLATLQKLLSKCGAPGSSGCGKPNDLQAIVVASSSSSLDGSSSTTPELVSSLSGGGGSGSDQYQQELLNLHPYLFPIAKSKSTGHYICAYRNPAVEIVESSDFGNNYVNKAAPQTVIKHPWPIVETTLNGPGMKILALNSEHLMRRIACEHDDTDSNQESEIVAIYNNGLGKGLVTPAALDAPYQVGSVAQLGYGVDKYVLLRVGPFADLYQSMSRQHAAKGSEQSCLIAAEAANAKLAGFASNFQFYAHVLSSSSSHRDEESRDAARMCLRLPLPTIGLTWQDFQQVAILGQVADPTDSIPTCLTKLRAMYEKIHQAEKDDEKSSEKTPEQAAIDAANYIIDEAVLSASFDGGDGKVAWGSIRGQVAEKFRSIGRNEFAAFVELQTVI